MNPEDTSINAVNWEHGMLLTPDHLLRQERYFEATQLWILRYVTCAFGLIGGGARLPESEFGAVRHDPIVIIAEDDQTLRVSVSQCRGLTPSGTVIDIRSDEPIDREFGKSDLEGVSVCRVYVIGQPFAKEVTDGVVDEFNPQMQTERKSSHRLALKTSAATSQYAISVALLRRRSDGVTFEKDSGYIPPCTNLVSYSELTAKWRCIVDELTYLVERSIELHRAMQEYIVLSRDRRIDTELDHESLNYVSRMVPALESCLYDCLDPIQSPITFFGHLRKLFHGAALSLDLSPPVQQYFDTLKETGETAYVPLIEQQRKLLRGTRRLTIDDDLGTEVRTALASIRGMQTLECALEGKYVDFRISPMIESMNFLFDRGGEAFFKLVAKPARLQGFAGDRIFYFTGLNLKGRDKYRLILSRGDGEPLQTGPETLQPGTWIPVDLRINEGSGSDRPSRNIDGRAEEGAQVRLNAQRNFELDFEAPTVTTISDLRVSVPLNLGLKVALLFMRYRLQSESPAIGRSGGHSTAEQSGEYRPAELPIRHPAPSTSSASPDVPLAPWDRREGERSQEKTDRLAPGQRRRRLE